MGSQDGGQDGKKPAEEKAPEAPQQKPPRTLKVADLRAAADRARSEVPEAPAKAPETQGADGAAKPGGEAESKAPTGEPAKADAPQEDKPADTGVAGKEVDMDPKDPNNPFWKTQLGRHIREQEAATTAKIAELSATVTLLKSEKKEPPGKPAPSSAEDDLERELSLAEKPPADKTATEGKEPKGDQETEQARYAKSYLANNAVEEYARNPMFGEVQALMFNKNDPENTFNRAWSGNPDADYRTNFRNAENFLLKKKISDLAANPPQPGKENLKGETPTAPLGVGGDVKNTDGRQAKPIELDEAGQRYLAHIKRKGRDPEKVMKRAFAVDLGAGRSAGR